MTRYIEVHRDRFGVEPICRVLQVAPSTYYAQRTRPPSARAVQDAQLKVAIKRVWDDNYQVYGAEKIWRQLQRDGITVGRDRVARLMRALGIRGVVRGAKRPTTIPADLAERPADLVDRQFTAPAPNRLWVADLTYVATWAGCCYTAFIIDAHSRAIVGWRVATTLRAELALDALEMAIWTRQDAGLDALVHHSDRGVQGGFNQSSQHLHREGVVLWRSEDHVRPIRLCVLGCGHLGGPRSTRGRSSSASGARSPRVCPARTLPWSAACQRRWGRGGSAKLVACHPSSSPRRRGATCRSPSARRSRCYGSASTGCV